MSSINDALIYGGLSSSAIGVLYAGRYYLNKKSGKLDRKRRLKSVRKEIKALHKKIKKEGFGA